MTMRSKVNLQLGNENDESYGHDDDEGYGEEEEEEGLVNLLELRTLCLSNNQFTGQLSAAKLSRLAHLQKLNLSQNQFRRFFLLPSSLPASHFTSLVVVLGS